MKQLRTLSHLKDYFGHGASMDAKSPIWADKTPVPWLTYSAISYLNQLDFSDKQVFEYGSGASTLYWSSRAKTVISVEHDGQWFEQMRKKAPVNVDLFLANNAEYVEKIAHKAPHDIVVVDGRWRYDCAVKCASYLNKGGLIILDNAERYPAITEIFRNENLIEVDFIGHGPQRSIVWCTSFFFSRDFNFGKARAIQPFKGPGMSDSIEAKKEHAALNISSIVSGHQAT